MATTRATRSSLRLSGQPSTEPQASATPTRKRAPRGNTPKASASTPRLRRKLQPNPEPREFPPSPPSAEGKEAAPVGMFFTNPSMFSNTTSQYTSKSTSKAPSKSAGQPTPEVPPTSTTQHPADPAPVPAEPPKPSSSKAAIIDKTPYIPETQELYNRIERNGYLVRTRARKVMSEAEQVTVAEPEADKQVQEQGPVVAAPEPETPKRKGWGWSFTPLKSVIGFFTPAKPTTQNSQPPATAPPAVVLAPAVEQEIHDALTPAPQARRKAPQTAKPKSRTQRKTSATNKTSATKKTKPKRDSLIVSRALESIDPQHHAKAREWVEQAALRYAEATPGRPGEKRKRFESGLRVADIEEIPAHYPWEQGGGFGLLEDFDDSDDEAPAWYILDQLANNRPIKRRKAAHNATMDEDIPSLNDLANRQSPPNPNQFFPVFNSHGNSASLKDIRPRPSIVPSPMFDSPVVHQPNGNIFKESQPAESYSAADEFGRVYQLDMEKKKNAAKKNNATRDKGLGEKELFQKELRRTGHVAGSGTFCVPESDSDSDDEEEAEFATDKSDDSSWLKRPSQQPESLQPPPPPIPAHATLPSPIKASPVVPPIQREASPAREDPVKIQRALAMKHTPAKPSRLREAMIPSPSLLSDAGNDSILTLPDSTSVILNDDDGMPQYMSLDLDMDIEEYVVKLVESESFKHGMVTAWGGSDVILRYDEDEEL